MKYLFLLCLFSLSSAWAASGDLGVGAMVGNPTGVSAKYWLEDQHAIDGGVGFSIGSDTNFTLHSDYLLQSEGALVFNDVHPLDLYFGLGGRLKFDDEIQMGARIPLGIAHRVEGTSDMFAEVAPVIDFVSRVGVDLNLLIGARYYFH